MSQTHTSCRRIVPWLLGGAAALLLSASLSLAAANPAQALPRLPQCANNIDDDNDGKIDFPFDSQCRAATDVQEAGGAVRVCSNGQNLDGDGKKFPADPGCASAWDPTEVDPVPLPACADGIDNDGDGKIDFQVALPGRPDPGCSWAAETSEVDTACSDTFDNDNDGQIDFPIDFGCSNVNDADEVDPPQCNDGRDNDGDGLLDFDLATRDPDCSSASDLVEAPPPPPSVQPARCDDGFDNDGDGKIDFPADPGCSSVADDDETDPSPGTPSVQPARCNDGFDNDGDGKIDFPADRGCSSAADDDETDPQVVFVVPSSVQTPLLMPFPIVRLRGRTDRGRVRITLLTVRAPATSQVSIYCTGRSCPRKRLTIRAGKKIVRVRQFERRLRGGTVLKIYVTKPGFIGKYTRFRFLNNRVPLRADRCARTPGAQPRNCPAS
ncbi:MAG: hypothetical protein ACR2H2_00460 [Solirubrobacteraceae bacterium]